MTAPDEFALIDEILRIVGPSGPQVIAGIGDDAAILQAPSHHELICTDAMVEGIHFDLSYSSPEEIGHKALASCLSDIAAMNGIPRAALFSIALPKEQGKRELFLRGFYAGAGALARRHGVDIVGGDLAASPGPIFIDVVCTGSAENPKRRSGAKPGDLIAVSGTPGAAAAGLFALQQGRRSPQTEAIVQAHLRPQPRFDLLPGLNRLPGLCTALIDISDGLSSELHHIAENSNVGIELNADLVPLHPEAKSLAHASGQAAWTWALSGGEDYELLATLDAAKLKELGAPPAGFTLIGRVVPASEGLTIVESSGTRTPLNRTGFNHFR
jgi:thiamine-monophosphate kinase